MPRDCLIKRADELLRKQQCLAELNIGSTSFYAGIKAGIFPKQIKIGRSSRWLRSELDAAKVKLASARSSN